MKTLKQIIVDANQINRLNIQMNKISTFIEMDKLKNNPYNIDFETVYTTPIYKFIETDTEDSFSIMEKIYQTQLTSLNLDSADHNLIADYFFIDGNYDVRTVNVDLSYLNYLNYCLDSLYAWYYYKKQTNPIGEEPKTVQSWNIMQQLIVQTKGYTLIKVAQSDQIQTFKNINTIDYILRLFLLLLSVLVSLPLIYKASLRSGDVLLQLSKISSINITFYMQHYNKLSLLLKSSESNTSTLDKVDNFYTTEYRLKQFKEQISGINRGARYAKWNSSDKYRWIAAGLGFVLIFALSQIGGVVQYYMDGINLDTKVSNLLEVF